MGADLLSQLTARLPSTFLYNIRWQYVANLGVGVLGGIYLLLLGSELGLREFGVFSLSVAIATMIFNGLDMRLQEAVIRFIAPTAGERPAEAEAAIIGLFALDTITRLVALALVGFLAQPVSDAFFGGEQAGIEVILSGALLLATKIGNAPAVGLLRIYDRFDLNAKLQLLDWGLRLSVTAIFVWLYKLEVDDALIIAIFPAAIANILIIVAALRVHHLGAWVLRRFSFLGVCAKLRQMLAFISSSHGISICDSVVREVDTTIVSWHLGLEATAIYRMTKNFVQMLWRVADPVFLVVMPEIRRYLSAGDLDSLRAFLSTLTGVLLAAALALVAGALIVVPWLIDVALGPEFGPAGNLFPWMCWWIVISLPLIWTHALASAAGKPQFQLVANLGGNVLAAAMLLLITPVWGVVGAAISWSLGLALTFVGSYLLMRTKRVIDQFV